MRLWSNEPTSCPGYADEHFTGNQSKSQKVVTKALDPRHRSGRCVKDGREPDQTCRLPDSRQQRDFVGVQIHSKSATESPDSTRIPHKSTVQDRRPCDTPVNPPSTDAHEYKKYSTIRGLPTLSAICKHLTINQPASSQSPQPHPPPGTGRPYPI